MVARDLWQRKPHVALGQTITYPLLLRGENPHDTECKIHGNEMSRRKHTIEVSRYQTIDFVCKAMQSQFVVSQAIIPKRIEAFDNIIFIEF